MKTNRPIPGSRLVSAMMAAIVVVALTGFTAATMTVTGSNGTFTVRIVHPPGGAARDSIFISYRPDSTKVKCAKIYLVQTVRLTDQAGNAINPKDVDTGAFDHLPPDMTPGRTVVDHLSTEKDPYYNGEDKGKDTNSKGSSDGTTSKPTNMDDWPEPTPDNIDFPAGVTTITATFEVCAVCVDDGSVLDCFKWKYTKNKGPGSGHGMISDSLSVAAPATQEFKDAMTQFQKNHKNGTVCPDSVAEAHPGMGDADPNDHIQVPRTPHYGQSTQLTCLVCNHGGTDLFNVPWQASYIDQFGSHPLGSGTIPVMSHFDWVPLVLNIPPIAPGPVAHVLVQIDPANVVPEYDNGNNSLGLAIDSYGMTYEGAPILNELRMDQPGSDVDEYFELRGGPFFSLDNLSYIVLGDGTNVTQCGVIESITPLSNYYFAPDGYFAACRNGAPGLTGYDRVGETSINFENLDNVTHMLVVGFSGSLLQDLDTNDDGILDSTPWTSIVDAVAPTNAQAPDCVVISNKDRVYSTNTVGPTPTGAVPMMVWRCPDTGVWQIGDDNPPPVGGVDSPGRANSNCALPPPLIHAESRNPCVPALAQIATVTDSITGTPTTVSLIYSINGGANNSVAMTPIGGNRWQGTIPAQGVNGTRVAYHVQASNANGSSNGSNQGYFAGVTGISALRVNNPDGVNSYRYFGATVRGNVTVTPGAFSGTNTDWNIQDIAGGINIFKTGATPGVNFGDDLQITGSLDQFAGKLEMIPLSLCSMVVNKIGSGAPPAPVVIPPCQLTEAREGTLVELHYPTIDTAGNNSPNWVANRSYPIVECGGSVHLFIDVDTNIDGTPIISTTIQVTGIAGQFDTLLPLDSDYEIVPRSLSDIVYVGQAHVPDDGNVALARLYEAMPNPCRGQSVIRYQVPRQAGAGPLPVHLRLFDVSGRLLADLVDAVQDPGEYSYLFDSRRLSGVSSGIFFYLLEIDGRKVGGRKIVVIGGR